MELLNWLRAPYYLSRTPIEFGIKVSVCEEVQLPTILLGCSAPTC